LVGDGFAHSGVVLGLAGSAVVVVGLYAFSAMVARNSKATA
jgi:hypothetical protein